MKVARRLLAHAGGQSGRPDILAAAGRTQPQHLRPRAGGRIEAAPDPAALATAPPLLLVHGLADTVVLPLHAIDLAAALGAAGRRVRLRTYPGVGHVGVLAAMAAPVRALGLAAAPVLPEVLDFIANPGRQA